MRHSPSALAHAVLQGLLQILYPNTCWACGTALPLAGRYFCETCNWALTTDPHRTCPRCSSAVGPYVPLDDGCTKCRGVSLGFDRALRLGPYDGLLRDLILR